VKLTFPWYYQNVRNENLSIPTRQADPTLLSSKQARKVIIHARLDKNRIAIARRYTQCV
jgi:hypothetical protein